MLDTERALADCRCNVPPVRAKRVGSILPVGRDDDGAFLGLAPSTRFTTFACAYAARSSDQATRSATNCANGPIS